MKKCKLLNWSVLLLLAITAIRAVTAVDVIELKDGRRYKGSISAFSEGKLIVELEDGGVEYIESDNIKRIIPQAEEVESQTEEPEMFEEALPDVVEKSEKEAEKKQAETVSAKLFRKSFMGLTNPSEELLLQWSNRYDSSNYPGMPYVLIFEEHDIEFQEDASRVHRRRIVRKVLDPAAPECSHAVFFYFPNFQTAEVEKVRIIHEDGSNSLVPRDQISYSGMYPQYPRYNKLHKILIDFPRLSEGVLTEIIIKIKSAPFETVRPFLFEYTFQREVIINRSEVSLSVPEGMKTSYRLDKGGRGVAMSVDRSEAGKTVYAWTGGPFAPVEVEADMLPLGDSAPRLRIALRKEWEEIGQLYRRLMDGLLDKDIELKDEGIRKEWKKISKAERVWKIYEYVASAVDTVPVPLNQSGYVPGRPQEILESGRGNVLDKCFLLFKLLRDNDVPSELYYARPRDEGRISSGVPAIVYFTNAGVKIDLTERPLFLTVEPTVSDCMRIADWFQDADALSPYDGQPGPQRLPERQAETDTVKTTDYIFPSVDGSVHVSSRIEFSGSRADEYEEWKRYGQERLKTEMCELMGGFVPDAEISTCEIVEADNGENGFTCIIVYDVQGLIDFSEEGILKLSLPYFKEGDCKNSDDRMHGFQWPHKTVDIWDAVVQPPAGYETEFLPGEKKFDGEYLTFNAEFDERAESILFRVDRTRKVLSAPLDFIREYRKVCLLQKEVFSGSVKLRKKPPTPAPTDVPSVPAIMPPSEHTVIPGEFTDAETPVPDKEPSPRNLEEGEDDEAPKNESAVEEGYPAVIPERTVSPSVPEGGEE